MKNGIGQTQTSQRMKECKEDIRTLIGMLGDAVEKTDPSQAINEMLSLRHKLVSAVAELGRHDPEVIEESLAFIRDEA
ncbi:MAG: hypothetical protein HZA50_10030 [Planctomycetes bacterium]|nr:hypothetical protein [Planctomycetota bacterium]